MAEQRPIEAIVGKPKTNSEVFSTTETKEQKKARIASVLSRGITNDRLHVDLPDNLHGEWIHRDPAEILRAQSLGFRIDTEYAPKSALHNAGSSEAIIGDTIFMVCEKETKELIDEVQRDQFVMTHGDGRARERRNQKGDMPSLSGFEETQDMPRIDESVERRIDGTEVQAVVKQAIKNATVSNKPS